MSLVFSSSSSNASVSSVFGHKGEAVGIKRKNITDLLHVFRKWIKEGSQTLKSTTNTFLIWIKTINKSLLGYPELCNNQLDCFCFVLYWICFCFVLNLVGVEQNWLLFCAWIFYLRVGSKSNVEKKNDPFFFCMNLLVGLK